MQIVIDIPEEAYKQIMEFGFLENTHGKICYKAIKNGTVLPEHGRLIDADAFEKDNSELWGCDFIHPKYCDTLADLVSNAPTILEATGVEE